MTSGLIALIFVFENQLVYAAFFVFLGIFFDFFDGFFARLLHVQSPLGLQLDSLADLITSGVVPGITVYKILSINPTNGEYIPYIGLLLTLAAGYRLAKFNIDTRQSVSFIGLPTPAMSIFIMSLPLVVIYGKYEELSQWIVSERFLIATVIVLSYLMNSELHLFALKFKSFNWNDNNIKYIFLFIIILLFWLLNVIAIPLIIVSYVILSMIIKLFDKRQIEN
jgi:CDP-diacylglycerol--serine O-phosphatidyltransferase